ncbi:MAG: quinoprotein relay system zinc metallohydrolase 2 [Geminicoccaceae bacterium]
MRLAAAALAVTLFGAAAGAAGPAPLTVTEIVPGVFVHQGPYEEFSPANGGGIANLGFVVGERSVAVIDSGGSLHQGEALLAAVRARTPLPVSHVILTHAHPDHTFGTAAFTGEGVAVVGHARLAAALAQNGPIYLANLRQSVGPAMGGTEIVPPTEAVSDTATIDLGRRVLELRAWPLAHTDSDLTVLDRRTGTLFAGDLLFMERIPVVDGSLLGWLRVMGELTALPATRVVPGHGPPSAPWPEAARPQHDYLVYLRDRVREALAGNRTLEQAVVAIPPPPGAEWLLAADNHARNVTASFTELEWE